MRVDLRERTAVLDSCVKSFETRFSGIKDEEGRAQGQLDGLRGTFTGVNAAD